MKTLLKVLALLFALTSHAYATDVLTVSANLGSQLGKATKCGFETEEFARLSGRTIDSLTSYGSSERAAALKQFMTAATMSAQTGPVSESCAEFKVGYDESLKILKERN